MKRYYVLNWYGDDEQSEVWVDSMLAENRWQVKKQLSTPATRAVLPEEEMTKVMVAVLHIMAKKKEVED